MELQKNNKLWSTISLILFVVLMVYVVKNLRDVETIILKAGVAGPLVAILLYGIFAATPITTDPLTLIGGAIFGPVVGIAVSWMGNNLAATVEYYVGKRLDEMSTIREAKAKLPFGLSKLPVNSPWFLIFGRLIPGYGGKVISIMAGMYHVPVKRYLWTTALTNLLGSVLLSYGGYNLAHLVKV
jgi:uncharacterized membrane protein YdjX (TVP38/TMEM64 family)